MIFSLRCRLSDGTITMHELKTQVEHLFQNLSEPWCTDIEQLLVANAPAAQKSSSPGLVSSISAALTRPLEKATGPSSWLSRKSSFKAAAKQIRSVSVTTMIPRSPSTQHARVPSIKSAKASIMRKNSSSDYSSQQQACQGNVTMQPSPTSSSICTTASQDMTSLSMPSLEHKNQGNSFWIYDDDEDSEGDVSSRLEVDSIIEDEIAESGCIGFNENAIGENEGYFNETDWAKAALQKRLDKGRVDSTSTNEVTYINTILNQSLTVTDEGQAIRRRIADDTCSGSSPPAVQSKPQPILIINQRQTSEEISSLCSMDPPPILTIEPPSPMPFLMCASPQSDSDHRGTKQSLNESTTSAEAASMSSSSHDLQSKQLFLRPNAKQRRRGKRSSNSFCVRDRSTSSQATTSSTSRSSSLPPNNFNFCVDYFDCNENTTNSVPNTTSSYPRRLQDNANYPSSKNGSSRHSSGEPENIVTGCSPKGTFFLKSLKISHF